MNWQQTLFQERVNQGRATTDVAQAARAATFGAIDTILVDIDQAIPGKIGIQRRHSVSRCHSFRNTGVQSVDSWRLEECDRLGEPALRL
jgi:hypothetical protein